MYGNTHKNYYIYVLRFFVREEVRGMAALRVLELLSGFWSCSKGFGVKCGNLSDLL